MICQGCGQKESTGILVHLCDSCFDQWEANINKSLPVDLGPIDSALKYQSAGGNVPDNVKGVRIRFEPIFPPEKLN